MPCRWRYLQGCLDPSSQLVSLLIHAAGGIWPGKPRIALPGCIVLLPPVSQNSPTSVSPLGCTSVLQSALALAASICKTPGCVFKWLRRSCLHACASPKH